MSLKRFENKPSTNTPINANNLNYNFDEVNAKDFIIATINAAQSVLTDSKVNLNSVYYKKGTSFSLNSNGDIVIGADVSLIEISGNTFCENLTNGSYGWGKIYKNNNFEVGTICPSTIFAGTPIPPVTISVNEGDVISLYIDSPSGGNLRPWKENTFLQVKKVM